MASRAVSGPVRSLRARVADSLRCGEPSDRARSAGEVGFADRALDVDGGRAGRVPAPRRGGAHDPQRPARLCRRGGASPAAGRLRPERPVPSATSSSAQRGVLGVTRPWRLVVDPIKCDAHGLCAELLPEMIELDDWGYPMVSPEAVPRHLERHAERAVAACPPLA